MEKETKWWHTMITVESYCKVRSKENEAVGVYNVTATFTTVPYPK